MSGTWFLIGAAVGFLIGSLCQHLSFWLYKRALKEAAAYGWTVQKFFDYWDGGNSQVENWGMKMSVLTFIKRLLGLDKAVFDCLCGSKIELKVPLRKKRLQCECVCRRSWHFSWQGNGWNVGYTLEDKKPCCVNVAALSPIEPSVAGAYTPDPEDFE